MAASWVVAHPCKGPARKDLLMWQMRTPRLNVSNQAAKPWQEALPEAKPFIYTKLPFSMGKSKKQSKTQPEEYPIGSFSTFSNWFLRIYVLGEISPCAS